MYSMQFINKIAVIVLELDLYYIYIYIYVDLTIKKLNKYQGCQFFSSIRNCFLILFLGIRIKLICFNQGLKWIYKYKCNSGKIHWHLFYIAFVWWVSLGISNELSHLSMAQFLAHSNLFDYKWAKFEPSFQVH